MGSILYPLYTMANFGLAIWSIDLLQQSNNGNIFILILVIAGMIYDNLIISLGRLINEGMRLELLNRLRFFLHDILIPLLLVVAVKLAGAAGVVWATQSLVSSGSWGIALGLIAFGVVVNSKHLELTPTNYAGILRYKPKKSYVPILTIFTALIVGVAGFYIWREIQWPWMFAGTVVMFVGNAFPTTIVGPLLGSTVDFIFILALVLTQINVY